MTDITIRSGGKSIKTTTEQLEDATTHASELPKVSKALGEFVQRYRDIMRRREEALEPIKRDLEELKLDVEAMGSGIGIIKSCAKIMDIIEEKGQPHYHAVLAHMGNALDALGVESGIQGDLFGRWVSGQKKAATTANKDKNDIGDTKGNA